MSSSDDDLFDVVSDYAEKAAKEAIDDPLGFVAKVTGAPEVSIDTDDSDGNLSFKYKSILTDIDAKWEDGKGSSVSAQAGADLGPAPLFKGKVATDAEGEVTELGVTAKATIPIEGVLASGEASTGYVKTDDGFKANYSYSAGAEVDGINLKGGTHGSYEDHGDRGYNITVGPHGSAGVGAGKIAEGFDVAEGEAKVSNDLSFGELDGQTTYGAKNTTELEGKVMGQSLANAKVETGVAYTTGPNGEQVIVDQRYSGQIGTDSTASAAGSTGTKWTVGVDGEGNEIDQVVSTADGKVTVLGEQQVSGSASTTYENATGIHELLNDDDVVAEDVPPEPQSYERYAMGEDSLVQPQQYAMGEDSLVEPQRYAMGEDSLIDPYATGENSDPQPYAMGENSYVEEQSSEPTRYAMGENSYVEVQSSDPWAPATSETVVEEVETYEITYEEPSAVISEPVVEEVETYEVTYEEPAPAEDSGDGLELEY